MATEDFPFDLFDVSSKMKNITLEEAKLQLETYG